MHKEELFEDELDRMKARRRKKGNKELLETLPNDDFTLYEKLEEITFRTPPEKGKKKKKKRLNGIFLLLLIALLGGLFLFQRMRDDGYWTVAVFGVDSRDGKLGKGTLADVSMICSINKKTGEMRLVSVFRDSYLNIDNDNGYHKINEAYFKGGHKQGVLALERNLDLKIDDYAVFNWKAVVDAINVLGGVDVEITDKEFAYINSFITETVNATGIGSYQLSQSGMNHLDGVQAVAYARLRLMDTDFNRTERQRKILGLALDKAKAADFSTLKTLVGAVFPQVSTSIGVDNILSMGRSANKYYIGQSSGFPFSHTEMKLGKLDYVIPTTLESNVIQLHEFLYEDSSYQPSQMVKKISNYIIDKTGLGSPGNDVESNRDHQSPSSGNKPTPTTSQTKESESTTAPVIEETEASSEEASLEDESIEESTVVPLETEESLPDASEPSTKETTGSLEGPGQNTGNQPEDLVGPGIS